MERMDRVLGSQRAVKSRERQLERKVATLQERLAKKDTVVAEISEEYVRLKKNLGNPERSLGCP